MTAESDTQVDTPPLSEPQLELYFGLRASDFARRCQRTDAQLLRVVEVLDTVLLKCYDGSLTCLSERLDRANENSRFCLAVKDAMDQQDWAETTKDDYMTFLKKLLLAVNVDKTFVQTLWLPRSDAPDSKLGKLVGTKRARSAAADTLAAWATSIRENTRNASPASIKGIVSFYSNQLVPAFGLELETQTAAQLKQKIQSTWDATVALGRSNVCSQGDDNPASPNQDDASYENAFMHFCGEPGTKRVATKAKWLLTFLTDVIQIADPPRNVPKRFLKLSKANEPADPFAMVGDVHKISMSNLDTLYMHAQEHPRFALMFLLFVTTGLRIGGVANIRINGVAEIAADGGYEVRRNGTTTEKGNKVVPFPLTKQVQQLILHWLQKLRPASPSPYLFPARIGSGPISTQTIRDDFKAVCKEAGLQGPEFHPHSLRHTFAHMLLNHGNALDVVSKCLNHSNTVITERFYLRENMEELVARANIPWLETRRDDGASRAKELPSFLKTAGSEATVQKKARMRQDADVLEAVSKRMFGAPPSSSSSR